ncbi:Cyclic nucleotide-binding domain-containing protein [Hymenobacter gelipurpurascens]|uniref:Cyclic nucleotide-binding domain-containing protein n=1 Tax=Hymenobacter gelipurpurascens TaxID=89968 RepID=A0A212T9Q8_9BACT|nr:cyclic nucleotide-binding domain-containing protein [Hymenobacter gelipurpurascens]SNC62725.1 Cyclic nucleotide-binding domain-containing protein [Hymenobacter gelipurpurascens]
MTLLERWQQLLGIRPDEGRTVGLFFLHNFLLGIGTILVYVSANVILLENNPERNLPLAYGVAALLMIASGKIYAHFEHHLGLQRVAVRVLLAVVMLTGVLGVLVAVGHSVAAAVVIMAGYRVIYLLTNLEFWGVSAVVFDVRQSRRLFSVISSGDMPAKALGAVLAILIHHHTELLWLLLTAFAAYICALLVLQATGRLHVVEARSAARAQRTEAVTPGLQRWFGSSRLVLAMCLSMLAIAAVTTGIEYSFFVNVKHRFHDQSVVMRYVGGVLALTYLLALVFKLLLTSQTLDRVGFRGTLLALPGTVLVGLGLYGVLHLTGGAEENLMLYFCGLFLALEVLRRAVFDPVFLILFQPLPATERLQAHTLAKGVYEPLGMGLAGVLLFAFHAQPALSQVLTFGWMTLLALAALALLYRAYGHYLAELQHAVSRRFAPSEEGFFASNGTGVASGLANGTVPDSATIQALIMALTDKNTRAAATDQLVQLGEAALPELTETLHTSTDEALIRRVAQLLGHVRRPASRQALVELARQPNLFRREAALRALRSFEPVIADAPIFQGLVQQELRLAHQLLLGQLSTANGPLQSSLDYELLRVQQRLFGLLLQLYPPQIIADAQRGVAHAARERQANALEMLDNLIPRPVYQGLQALLDVVPVAEKVRRFNALLSANGAAMSIVPGIVERGEVAYTDWTVSMALSQWHPTPYTVGQALPHLHSTNLLIQQSAVAVLDRFAHAAPEDYQHLLEAHPHLVSLLMSHHATTSRISATELVALLKNTALFSETPENVLSSIVPIMKEVTFREGEQIFAKGDLGTSLFIVQEGEVNILSGTQQLATFRPGDFFGELALLDAEPRSASAVAHGSVVAFRLDQEDFYDVMEERGEVLRNIMRVLCQRLRRQNEKMQVPEVK